MRHIGWKFANYLGLALLFFAVATPHLLAQNQIVLGDSSQEFHFQSSGGNTMQLVFADCMAGSCILPGSAFGTGVFASSSGQYAITSPASNIITLTFSSSDSGSSFAISQTAPLQFSYSSPQGTLTGYITLFSFDQGANSDTGNLSGGLQITGGSLASGLASDEGMVSILVPLGGSLVALQTGGGVITGQIGYPSTITLAPDTDNACGVCRDFVTGGGWIIAPDGAHANFGVHGGIRHGAFWGHLEYNDHGSAPPMTVKSTGITNYLVLSTDTREIDGTAEVNGQSGYSFKVVVTDLDNGPGEGPGPNHNDSFSITLSNGYSASGNLEGGDIQIHHGKCENGLEKQDNQEHNERMRHGRYESGKDH